MPQGEFPIFYTFHFYLFGIIAIVSTLLFITHKNPITTTL